jgi:DNA repair exonuclease SbcCD ATPase subunit
MRQTDKLLNNLKTTTSDVKDLQNKVKKAQDKVRKAIKTIKDFEEVDDGITTIDNTLKGVSTVMVPFTMVPAVGTAVSATKKTIDTTKKVISPIRKQSNKLDKKAKDVRPKLEKFDKKITALQTKLTTLRNTSDEVYNKIKPINDCAVEIKSSSIKGALDVFSKSANPPVEEINSSLKKCIDFCEDVESKANAIENALKEATKISVNFEGLINALEKIEDALKPIQDALKFKISIPYSFKIKIDSKKWWKIWEWGWKTVNYRFSIQQILDGINSGISAVNDLLMKAAEKVLKSLKIKMPSIPSIPGLSKLKKLIDGLFSKFDISDKFEDLYDELREIVDAFNSLKVLSLSFNIKCIKNKK